MKKVQTGLTAGARSNVREEIRGPREDQELINTQGSKGKKSGEMLSWWSACPVHNTCDPELKSQPHTTGHGSAHLYTGAHQI